MATVSKRLVGPSFLTTSAVTQYTVPASTRTVIQRIHISNASGAPVTFTMSIGADAAGARLYDGVSIAAGRTYDAYGPFTLEAAEIIQALASANSALVIEVTGSETDTGATAGVAVSANGRYFTKNGAPWLPNIAAGSWFAIQAISNADSDSFFSTLTTAGFNTMHTGLIMNDTGRYPSNSGNHFAAPNWNNGGTVAPFTTPGRFDTPNATYFAHALERVQKMGTLGLFPILIGTYPGFNGNSGSSSDGWAAQLFGDTDAHLQAFGVYCENLLTGIDHIWTSGGDVSPTVGGTLEDRLVAFYTGAESVASRIWGAHLEGGNGKFPYDEVNIGALTGMTWSLYSYDDTVVRAWWRIEEAYTHSPTRPAYVLDPSYVHDPPDGVASSRERLRDRDHSCMCSGSCSLAYARGGDVNAATDAWYRSATNSWLTTDISLADHIIANTFWQARPWWSMAPDLDNSYMISGRGAHTQSSTTYVTCLRSPTKLIAHFPIGAGASPTVNMAKFSSYGPTIPCKWVDPTGGPDVAVTGSPIATSGTHAFAQSQPGNNSAGTTDWLLEIG